MLAEFPVVEVSSDGQGHTPPPAVLIVRVWLLELNAQAADGGAGIENRFIAVIVDEIDIHRRAPGRAHRPTSWPD